jgi:hypothetical protein
MFGFLKQLGTMLRFMQLPKAQKRIVIYSESPDYWVHLSGLVVELLKITNVPICYISSDKHDPGLQLTNPNYHTFYIAAGYPCTVLFTNIETDIMVMTMPDLDNYQLKRSKHKVHYVYVQHSLVSLHMIYRSKAFDNFDTIFCAGAHHVQEIRALEQTYNLRTKNLVEHGYSRLDAIIQEAAKQTKKVKLDNANTHILIAPSWGEHGIIETIGQQLVEILLTKGFKITLRPHPQTIKFAGDKVKKILRQHGKNPLFNLEVKMVSQASLHQSDLIISDWSGAAMDYAFGLNKPVLFIDVPRKVNNLNYKEIGIEPIEVSIRSQIGAILAMDELDNIAVRINSLLNSYDNKKQEQLRTKTVFNLGAADSVGAQELQKLINEI